MEEENKVININEGKKEININEEKKGIDIEDIRYRLEEMEDAMQQSIDNIEKINKQQNKLLDIIKEKEENAKEFEDFIEDTNKQIKQMEEQKNQLVIKKEVLTLIIAECKENKLVSRFISMLSFVIGLFK